MKSFFHFLNEAQSNAAKQAKKLGLVGDGHGSWVDPNGRIVGRTVDGELVFNSGRKPAQETDPNKPGPAARGLTPENPPPAAPGQGGVEAAPEEEAPEKEKTRGTLTIGFGRFNPPTSGHEKLLDKITAAAEQEQQIVLLDPASLSDSKAEPDMRIIGMFCDVAEEKVAEVIHAMLYLNELNKLEKKPEDKRPIDFYLSTYGGSADDMFALYDIMRTIRQDTEIHTLGLGKVMSAGVLLLAAGTKGKRRIAKNCRVMIHSVAAGNHGNLQDLTNELEAISDLQEMYTGCLAAESNMTESDIKDMLNRNVNVYLSATEAVKLGIADIIV